MKRIEYLQLNFEFFESFCLLITKKISNLLKYQLLRFFYTWVHVSKLIQMKIKLTNPIYY